MLNKLLNQLLIGTTGYRLIKNERAKQLIDGARSDALRHEPHVEKQFDEVCKTLENIYPLCMVSETDYSVFSITNNIINQNLDGCFVECGVYRGQKISVIIETLKLQNVLNRDIYIIDTFKGMTEPSEVDYGVIDNNRMQKGHTYCDLKQVKENILGSGYPEDRLHFIMIDVREKEQLKNKITQNIALLRLDTDFHDSILSSLEALYPKVVKHGYIIHDDYGHWKGHYSACNDYYRKENIQPCLIRTCRKERVEIKST
jgi:hypothetical protein